MWHRTCNWASDGVSVFTLLLCLVSPFLLIGIGCEHIRERERRFQRIAETKVVYPCSKIRIIPSQGVSYTPIDPSHGGLTITDNKPKTVIVYDRDPGEPLLIEHTWDGPEHTLTIRVPRGYPIYGN